MRSCGTLILFSLGATLLGAQTPDTPKRSAASLGFAPARLARIDSVLQRAVDSNLVPGVVALVTRDGRTVYERAVGWADREGTRRMRADDIFRIASQSKAVTTVAAMMLVEEGKLALNDPVSRYMPTFSATKVSPRSDSGRSLIPARRAITIRDLLTHTAGISYGTDPHVAQLYAAQGLGPSAGYGYYTADKSEPICATMDRLGNLPFVAQPGEAFVYGYSTDVMGCIVERVSGLSLDEFFRKRIFEPLGMRDTHFYLPPAKRERLAVVYGSDSTGHAVRAPEGARGQGHYVDGPRQSYAGGAGLLSTARDYARFLQMLLNGGELGGVRLLAPKTVRLMTTNLVGTLYSSAGMGFGLGFSTVDRAGAEELSSVGAYGWGGAYSTSYRVDPAERIVMVFMIQMVPNRSGIPARLPTLVYQALMDPRQ